VTRASADPEWERLVAERVAVRRALVESLDALEARARDPFRLKRAIRRHPVLTAGIAAGAGALLVRLVVGRGSVPPSRPDAAPRESDRGSAPLVDSLLDLARRAATPWVARFVAEHFAPRPAERSEANGAEREEVLA
jgi:hypothetical protein